MSEPIRRVGVVGAGTMGNGIAQAFAQSGFDVSLVDAAQAALDRARATIDKSLTKLVEKGKLATGDRDAALARLSTSTSIDALADADFVVEAIDEDLEAKRTCSARSIGLRGPASSCRRTRRRSRSPRSAPRPNGPDKVLGMHFMNPVPLMTLVELIRGQATSDESMARRPRCASASGKTAVEAADYPGLHRQPRPDADDQRGDLRVMEGVGTPEAIDTVMKLGMNHPMGPLTLADFIGLDVCLAILDVLHDGLGDPKYRPCPLLRRMVAAGQLGRKSGRGFLRATDRCRPTTSCRLHPRARRLAVALWIVAATLGTAAVWWLSSYIESLTVLGRTDRDAAAALFRSRVLPALWAVALVSIVAGAVLARQGYQVLRAGRFPLDGTRVLRDTRATGWRLGAHHRHRADDCWCADGTAPADGRRTGDVGARLRTRES